MRADRYSLSDLPSLEDAWRHLEQGSDMTVFQGYDWYEAVAANVRLEGLSRGTVTHRIYVVRDEDGTPVMLAPLRMHHVKLSPHHVRGVHFMGRNGSADYLNFVYRDFSPAAASLILEAARRDFHTTSVVLERVLASTSAFAWLDSCSVSKQAESAVAIEVPETSEAYQSLLSKRARQNVRTARNRAQKDGLSVDIRFGDLPSTEDAKNFADLKAQRGKNRERHQEASTRRARLLGTLKKQYLKVMFSPGNEATALMTSHPHGWHMSVLLGGELSAFAYGFREDWHPVSLLRVVQVAFDDRFARYSPGMLGLHELLTGLAADDHPQVRVVDFTRGEEPYKFALGAERHTYATFVSQSNGAGSKDVARKRSALNRAQMDETTEHQRT